MSSTSSSIVTPLDRVSSSTVATAPESLLVTGTLVDEGVTAPDDAPVVVGVPLVDEASDEVVFEDVAFDDVVFDDVVLTTDELVAAPAAAVPVTPDAQAVSDTTDKNEIPAMTALMDDRMTLLSQ
jgi:hypothetical protein